MTADAVDPRIASFDIFDTVLTRVVTDPPSAWLLLGRRLARRGLVDTSPEGFMRMRRAAQERVHRNARWGEFTLRQVYAEMAAHRGWSEDEVAALMAEEYRLEGELLRVVPGAPERIDALRRAGHRIVFLSDMYLDGAFLCEQLRRHGLMRGGDHCHVSCELGHPKRDGGAFRAMAGLHAVGIDRVLHHGNHPEFDIRGGQRAGARTHALYEANPNRYERALEHHGLDSEGLSAIMAGAARLARLSVPAATRHEEVLRDLTAGVLAPALAGYVIWVVGRARRMGLRHLLFLHPGAEVLREVARQVAPALGYVGELHSLPAGRGMAEGEAADPRLSDGGIFGGGVGAGIVELGWEEEPIEDLAAGLPRGPDRPVPVFRFAARGSAAVEPRGVRVLPYLANLPQLQGFIDVEPELLFSILLPAGGTSADDARREVIQRSIRAFAESLHLDADLVAVEADVRPAIAAAAGMLLGDPSGEEARACGALAAAGGTGNDGTRPLPVRPYGPGAVPASLSTGRVGSREGGEWAAACMTLTPRPVRTAIRAAAFAGRSYRRLLRRLPGSLRRRVPGAS